jgi:predicted enzyme related to lactoylglutathione lyase
VNALLSWINMSTPMDVAADFYGSVLGAEAVRASTPPGAGAPLGDVALARTHWIPLVGLEMGASVHEAPRARRPARLVRLSSGAPIALVAEDSRNSSHLGSDLPTAALVGDAQSVAGGLRVEQLTPAVFQLFADVFGNHLVVAGATGTDGPAPEPTLFVAVRRVVPDAEPGWIPLFRVADVRDTFERAVTHGGVACAAPTNAPESDLTTASLRDPHGAPFMLLRGALASWELMDSTHHIMALTRSKLAGYELT